MNRRARRLDRILFTAVPQTHSMGLFKNLYKKIVKENVWARPGMAVTFRAEVMPGKSREARTFRIEKVLWNGRVRLHGFAGEHRESAFEPLNFKREKGAAG